MRKKTISFIALGLFLVALNSCKDKPKEMKSTQVEIQGHRGARGLMPENTIPAFLEALKIGAHTLELDLAVTKDKELLVSHEPYMKSSYCLDPEGNEISQEAERANNIYQMTYQEVKSFDCGTKINKGFPDQQKFKVNKPLFKDLVQAVNVYLEDKKEQQVKYNIEIKSSPNEDNVFHPAPPEFSDLVYDFIQENLDPNWLNVQSFDFRILQYFHEKYPEIELAVLIGNQKSIDENLKELGFKPEIYSCHYKLLSKEKVEFLHEQGMKVIPWTINETDDMKKVTAMGVDGIITDYPDRAIQIVKK
jgi:glycerophosphoryl diester phosphodiesterase